MSGDRSGLDVLLVGIDGASFRVLEPLFEDGALPHLASIFGDGQNGELTSQIPPWTASAWPSLYTGTNPGKHGVFGFLSFDGYDWDVVNATDVTQRPLWHYLDEAGHRSVVVNVPVTYPASPFDGALLPGYTAPENPECYPQGILEDVRDAIGGYRIYGDTEGEAAADNSDLLSEYRDLIGMRGRAFQYLCDRFDPDFGFVQFQQTDTVCHEYPGDQDAFRTVYGAVDEQVGEILDATSPDTVFVVSDHGLGPYEQRVAVNEFLREAGHVETTTDGAGMPTWATIREGELRDVNPDLGTRLLERSVAALASVGLTTQTIGRALNRVGLADIALDLVPDDVIRSGSSRVDFAASTAFVRSRVECGVRINLAGREPDGVVPPEEYEGLRNDLIDFLSGLTGPDGRPIFAEVGPREQYFHGSESEKAVDVVTVPRSFDSYVTTWLTEQPIEPVDGTAWDHKRQGVIAARGAAVTDGTLGDAHLFDVAPTVLAAMGVPAAERMDGRTLPVVESAGERRFPDFEDGRDRTTESEAVESRLADLGYLE